MTAGLPLVAEGLRVRAFLPGDLEAFHRFRADPASAAQTYGSVLSPETVDDVRRSVEAASAAGYLVWAWTDESDGLVGFSVLSSVDRVNRTLWTGSAVIDPARRGRGLGSLGRRLVLDFVFNEMDFRRIYGEFGAFNEASRRSHMKMGAEVIGVRRQAYFISGRHHDAVMYTIARERFNALFPPDADRCLGVRK
ncbi:MAG TPA: GNAT family protein [Candidatus Dormibacteraeota bacterium]|nr:GNAT family protein [Candidatus Dormibacteraeota bacterium]